MIITVNGQQQHLRDGLQVSDVVSELTSATRGIAVAVNGEVIARGRWASTPLGDGDRIEVLTAVQGG